jgi:hypothetical protein
MTTYNTTNYVISTPELGFQPISTTSTTQKHPLGKIVTAVDPTYGEGTFVYLPGVASTVVGSVVLIDTINNTTTLAVHTTAARGILAVAMSANVASQYGWYQIEGSNPNVLSTGTTAVGSKLYLTSTAGQISTGVVSGDGIDGAIATVATSAGVGGAQLNGPCATGNG